MAITPFAGSDDNKLFEMSGQFTTTVKSSININLVDTETRGIEADGTDQVWIGNTDNKLYLQSGFTSTLKTSQSVSGISTYCYGVSEDGTDTPWADSNRLYQQSGKFTSTLKTSYNTYDVDNLAQDVSSDGTDNLWIGGQADKLYLQSAFTTTLKTSQAIGSVDVDPQSISWDGVNTIWCGTEASRLYLQSGRFTSTLKTSEVYPDTYAYGGLSTDDVNGRLGLGGGLSIPVGMYSYRKRRT